MSIETMKQALDWFKCYRDKSMSRNNAEALAEEVENTLRQAIEQAEKQEDHAKDCALLQIPSRDCDCSQNQELVAWGVHDQLALNKMLSENPPKREWVKLTDEEMKKVHTETGITYLVPADYDHHLFTHITDLQIMKVSRAIEAKLRSKNT